MLPENNLDLVITAYLKRFPSAFFILASLLIWHIVSKVVSPQNSAVYMSIHNWCVTYLPLLKCPGVQFL